MIENAIASPFLPNVDGTVKSQALPSICMAAAQIERETGVPAELTVAQCALESGWLDKMPPGSSNPFGIKGNHENGVLAATTEWFNAEQLHEFLISEIGRTATLVSKYGQDGKALFRVQDWFKRYTSLNEAFLDHGNLIIHGAPYREAFTAYEQNHDLHQLVTAIAPHYSTSDPEQYAKTIIEIANDADVRKTLDRARQVVAQTPATTA